MRVSIGEIVGAFHFPYESIHNREFRKTLALNEWSEREMLPLVRMFLLGCFQQVVPEFSVKLPRAHTGRGRVDFLIGNTAVEFAVRRPGDGRGPLSDKVNADEIAKLTLHEGPSLLVLFDFSKSPYDEADIDRFKTWRSFGQGNFRRFPFNVSYHFIDLTLKEKHTFIQKNISPARLGH